MPTNETHTLTTIADLFRVVTMDNVDALAADLRGILVNAAATKALIALTNPASTVDIFENTTSITWCDDGVNQQRITATSKSGNSLEFVTKGKENN